MGYLITVMVLVYGVILGWFYSQLKLQKNLLRGK
jgi:uncharacterized protein YneF (UPF0154 family)